MEGAPEQNQTPERGSSVGEAVAHIEAVRAQIHQEGNVDTEDDALNRVRQQLEAGHMSPQDAMEAANQLLAQRNLR